MADLERRRRTYPYRSASIRCRRPRCKRNHADLSGWFIWSEKGSELFVFPQGASIRAGVPLVVACRGGRGDYIWDDKKVWGDKADEAGVLYTSGGAEAARSN